MELVLESMKIEWGANVREGIVDYIYDNNAKVHKKI